MESLLSKEELLTAVKGTQIGSADCLFNDVQTDSRNVSADKPCMFVPLMGEFQNGHKYIPDVLKDGKKASVVLINKTEYQEKASFYDELAASNAEVCFVLVENTLHALQDAAEAYVAKKCRNMILVSITGSSGKTTTKEMMVSVAKAHFGDTGVAYTYGNLNSETGLPLSVFKIRGHEKIGIFEMGMNRVNEIGEISKVLKPVKFTSGSYDNCLSSIDEDTFVYLDPTYIFDIDPSLKFKNVSVPYCTEPFTSQSFDEFKEFVEKVHDKGASILITIPARDRDNEKDKVKEMFKDYRIKEFSVGRPDENGVQTRFEYTISNY
jgi:hypothetical protein